VALADDVEDVRFLLGAALEATGRFELVGVAADGAEAVDLVRRTTPDLLLLDIAMPGVGGLEALPEIRAVSPLTSVVIVSGFPRGKLAEYTTARGAVGYVEKGASPHQTVDEVLEVAGVLAAVEQALAGQRTRLGQDVTASAAARRFVEETLARWDCASVLDTVNLLVSELVTNAVIHARSEADVAVRLTADAVRVEVSDQASGAPARRVADDEATSGRGFEIVEALASAWGVEPGPTGKTVWFEVPRPDASRPAL
jgi:DNA-binding NarL/FixJ family response regulator